MKTNRSYSIALAGWGASLRYFCSFALIVLVASAVAAGQTVAQVAWGGVLRNASGAPIADATVRLSSGSSKAEGKTGSDGRFSLAMLPAGKYHLSVTTKAGASQYAPPVVLTAGAPEALLTLSERGELTVAAVRIKAQAATGGEELSSQAVSELPLNKRDFSYAVAAGGGNHDRYQWRHQLYRSSLPLTDSAASKPPSRMDGADISDPEMGGATFLELQRGCGGGESTRARGGCRPRLDAARRATPIFIRAPVPADFTARFSSSCATPRLTRATISITRRPRIQGRIPPFRRNEFGFTNGGPVFIPHVYDGRKRTFYFGQYQGFRQVLGTTQVMPVPAAIQRPQPGSNYVDHVIMYPDQTADTLSAPVDPAIAAILARYPLPNLPTGSFGHKHLCDGIKG